MGNVSLALLPRAVPGPWRLRGLAVRDDVHVQVDRLLGADEAPARPSLQRDRRLAAGSDAQGRRDRDQLGTIRRRGFDR